MTADDLPIVTFDTSAHNRFVEDGPLAADSILVELKSQLFFRFAGLSIEELASCPDPIKRVELFDSCNRILDGPSDCLYPHYELLRLLIQAHHSNPSSFEWWRVYVRAPECEQGIRDREFINDEALVAEQRQQQLEDQKNWKKMFVGLRPKLEEVFTRHGEEPPRTFDEAFSRENRDGGLISIIGKLLYDRAAQTNATEATVRDFRDVCPPFRALVYAGVMSWFDIAVRDRQTGEKFQAGRNDLFMSAYLPYCSVFVTAEKKGEQLKCLRKIVEVAKLQTEVLSYDDFVGRLLTTSPSIRINEKLADEIGKTKA